MAKDRIDTTTEQPTPATDTPSVDAAADTSAVEADASGLEETPVSESPMTALEAVHKIERAIILVGSKDPENFIMPDGRSLAEVQRENEARTKAEGDAYREANRIAFAEQSRQNEPLAKDVKLAVDRAGHILTSRPTPANMNESSPDSNTAGAPSEPTAKT